MEIVATYQMTPNIAVITLGVNDLERAMAFYRDGLGLATAGIIGTEFKGDETHAAGAIVQFHLNNGVILALYPRPELAKDAEVPPGAASSTEFSIGHFVRSKEEVTALMKRAEAAGATITCRPYERPFGVYSGYFKDLDDHLWEIIWNPEIAAEKK
jgi:uncharacterized protein